MRWLLAFLAICLAVGAGIFFLGQSTNTTITPAASLPIGAVSAQPATPPPPARSDATQAATAAAAPAQPAIIPETISSPTPVTNVPTQALVQVAPGSDPAGLAPATVLENMRTTIRQYGLRFGGNPVGTNPEITRALNGDNPKSVKFIPLDSGLRINEKGELVDPWGTPYFFHQLSGMQMEIHSAGPDKTMWTADDLVTK